jgi:hypothetical protein
MTGAVHRCTAGNRPRLTAQRRPRPGQLAYVVSEAHAQSLRTRPENAATLEQQRSRQCLFMVGWPTRESLCRSAGRLRAKAGSATATRCRRRHSMDLDEVEAWLVDLIAS